MLTTILDREGERYVFLEPPIFLLDRSPSLETWLGINCSLSVLRVSIYTLKGNTDSQVITQTKYASNSHIVTAPTLLI